MNTSLCLRLGAILGLLGVAAGAFGAHVLKERMQLEDRQLTIFETGVRYQMYHALALLIVGLVAQQGRLGTSVGVAGWSFLVGILLFSGSLYALALDLGPRNILGPITPLGGVAFLVGWAALALGATSLRGSLP